MMKSCLVSLFIFLIPGASFAKSLELIHKNNRAVKLYQGEKKTEAFEAFVGLTAEHPDDMYVRFNIASALQGLAQEEKAVQMNKSLLEDIDKKISGANEEELKELYAIKFAVLYNLGIGYQVMQKVDDALTHYQLALEMNPNSKEIKTNIELMFQGGQGKGKGDSKDEKSDGGEGDGENQKDESDEQKDDKGDKEQDNKQQQQQKKNQQKGFDQKYMSAEDLKRIMDELKEQEQNIRAKMERKGAKGEKKEKQW